MQHAGARRGRYTRGDHTITRCAMTPSGLIDQIAEQVSRLLPQGLSQEMRRNLHAALRSTFDRLELRSGRK
ncbi:MAG: hypothetical protein AMJ72_10500 [Acidithiobacillales bacterium SM1_46]|nr:MAG: hypothetical protein AMJ72_10500 [Acidithiobacillales bacterium SM1_46]